MNIVEKRGYRIVRPLASGGEGQVSICQKDGIRFILKVMPCMDSRQKEILSQIDALPGSYFPRVQEIFCDGEHSYLIREYIEGNTLRDELQNNGPLSYPRASRVFGKLCEALNLLHHASPQPILLRDLKPENIILTSNGGVYLIDFGIARHYDPQASRDTIPAGTRGYTAPEAMTGFQSDPRCDIYSLGIVFYEMLCGKNLSDPPFQLRPLSESSVFTPATLDQVLAKATDSKPFCRYTTVAEFQTAVEHLRSQPHPHRNLLSRVLYFLLGASVALGLSAAIHGNLFQDFCLTGAEQANSVFVVGLPIDEAEKRLSKQDVAFTVYGILSSDASADEVVSQSSTPDGLTLEVCIGCPNEIVSFSDPDLDTAIRRALDIPSGQTLIASDFRDLTVLDVSQQSITSLEGLQYAVNLTQLSANDNAITDISAIAYLGHLKTLSLSNNMISNLSPLSHLLNLKTLSLENNKVAELSALENIDFFDLSLGSNKITDLSPLSGAVHLQRLNLYGNRISDISALQSMQMISWLGLNENQINDLSPLSGLSSLETLILCHNTVYDASPVGSITNLRQLDLSSNYITDLSSFFRLNRLESLDLSANSRLDDISALVTLPNLQTLGLAYLEDCDYSPILSMPSLRSVTVCSPQTIQNGDDLTLIIEALQESGVQVFFQ